MKEQVNTFAVTFYRSYSRYLHEHQRKETWGELCDRVPKGIGETGKFTQEEFELLKWGMETKKSLPAGRPLFTAGIPWSDQPENFPGQYNCFHTVLDRPEAFGLLMELGMMGTGTGKSVEFKYISKLPVVGNWIEVVDVIPCGLADIGDRKDTTQVIRKGNNFRILVGDSRRGWVSAYQELINLAFLNEKGVAQFFNITVDCSWVRPKGEILKGFGGVANPSKLPGLFPKVAKVLNGAVGRQLNSVEALLVAEYASNTIVAGGIRHVAGMVQGDSDDNLFTDAKSNLWTQDAAGNWVVDPEKDVLRMSNHTRVYHSKPTKEECIAAVRKQYYSGEGAIQWAGEAIARANADVIPWDERRNFLTAYSDGKGGQWMSARGIEDVDHRLQRYLLNPCGEILGENGFICNLSEPQLILVDPLNFEEQEKVFKAGALSVSALLHHNFPYPVLQESRERDPIVGVGMTGLFDFFVNLLGVDWLRWWEEGRPRKWDIPGHLGIVSVIDRCISKYSPLHKFLPAEVFVCPDRVSTSKLFLCLEAAYLGWWKEIVFNTVNEYCDRHKLKRPNRCTTVKPAGTVSLLTGASPGWHPPKAQRYIRRITFGREDPIALACMKYGYSVVPSQADKDENGKLLDDPFDPRCTTWLIEIPVEVPWANLPGADKINISQFSAAAQFDFYMQVQQHYTTHNTSATIEFRENEIEALGTQIYEAIEGDRGYISAALLARFDDHQSFPRLPFEPIDKETYEQICKDIEDRRESDDLEGLILSLEISPEGDRGVAPCDSDKCII